MTILTTTPNQLSPASYHKKQVDAYFDSQDESHKKSLMDIIKTSEEAFKKGNIKVTPFHTELWLRKFITQDAQILELKDKVRQLATEEYPVLIQGETGTGKELIANALHGWKSWKLVAINCTSLPDYLLESELFGHKKGAFTGALEDKIGLFQFANEGTIFLDEIGDMPILLQAKLLRVLQEKRIRRVGDNQEIPINCRIVAATNQNLEQLIVEKKFREDLLWRIGTFRLHIKSLHSRVPDILLILKHLDSSLVLSQEEITKITSSEGMKGNVRYLESLVAQHKVFGKIL